MRKHSANATLCQATRRLSPHFVQIRMIVRREFTL
jgi:hypothetical protein